MTGAIGCGVPAAFRRGLRHFLTQIERGRGDGATPGPAQIRQPQSQTQSGFLRFGDFIMDIWHGYSPKLLSLVCRREFELLRLKIFPSVGR